ncbi:hypothetical protein ACMFMG_001481 [Clarireedia jacksonii]
MANAETPISKEGLNLLFDAEKNAKVDIVFVHGLMGHPKATWEIIDTSNNPIDPNETIYWPKDLLPKTIPESRVFSFGYPTHFATFYPIVTADIIAHTTIDHNSTTLVTKLGNIRRETDTANRPIFFIVHSLGGLVTANGLSVRYGSDSQGQSVVDNTRGVIFLGTPFKGSSKAVWAKMAERFLGLFSDSNDQIIKDLDKDSTKLQAISHDFHVLLQERYASKELKPIQIACFFETKHTEKKLGKLKGKKDLGQIVTADSATLAGYKPIAINADHLAMCKFQDAQTDGYVSVTEMLKLMISKLDEDYDKLKNDGRTSIQLGDIENRVSTNYGYVGGHMVGMTKDANRVVVSHNFGVDHAPPPHRPNLNA